MAIMPRIARGTVDQATVENGRTGVPALQHHHAGNRLQRVFGVFPDNAVGGWVCLDVDRKQKRNARSLSEFHGLFAAGKSGHRR